ncbi:cytochrome c oxidase subunit II [Lottiidibacillus patelloidae]|uniref:Cytochrome c oxidase subunit 2 n=1 Tax=Lottiidibacillus patelloidae TaxID=2670334 RepID=A0A263BXL8_9BACI|nr:cytochrome c oxidase subunit II [Lottiidibacillus patelloidae]OZM58454.1 cytochrome c oxidase subunit II [Lottiidibacillus patelloidae]
MKIWQKLSRIVPLFALLTLVLSGCGRDNLTALVPKGEGAEINYSMMMISLYIMIGVLVVVFAIYTYVVIKYRKRPGQENVIPKQTEGNHLLELVWTVIPIILLIILAIPTVITTFELAEDYSKDENAVKINVKAYLYWWDFEYPEYGVRTAQDLYMPTGERVSIALTSEDVIHSFWVPTLQGKMDNNPGEENVMWISANEPGVYRGKCAELCGVSHALMDFKVIALDRPEFDKWIEAMQAPPKEMTTPLAIEGQQLFESKGCIGCHAVGEQKFEMAGPNLKNFGEREVVAGILYYENEQEQRDQIANWLINTMELKPGNKMGKQVLTQDEVDALVEYLINLKVLED